MKHVTLLRFLILFYILLTVGSVSAQPPRFSYEKFGNDKGDTLLYRQLFPDADTLRKYPLVIFLHGSGERGHDNDAQLKWGVMNFATDANMVLHPCFVIAPQCPEGSGWSNFSGDRKKMELNLQPTPAKPMELLIGLIHKMIKSFNIDSNRIYITGLSMGGFGTYDAIERYPHLFAAAVPVCGGGDVSKASSIAHIPIWIYHGSDDPAVSPLYALNMLEALTKAGARPGFTQLPETGHFSWLGAYSDARIMEWMFRQHK